MYRVIHFETAIIQSGYNIERVSYGENLKIARVEGSIPYLKRAVINGKVKYIHAQRLVRWDDRGKCFSLRSKIRQPKYDLPLKDIVKTLTM